MIKQTWKCPEGIIHYWRTDEFTPGKKTIFFFHGLTGDHTMFADQFDYFKERYNLIIWDAPMHGMSRPFRDFSMQSACGAIFDILDELGVYHVIAVGHSFGGYFAQSMIKWWSARVEAFVGIGTSPYGKDYYSATDKLWLRAAGGLSRCIPFKTLRSEAAKRSAHTEKGYLNMRSILKHYSKQEYAEMMKVYYSEFLKENCDIDIKCPVLITHGEYDKTAKIEQYCKRWHERTGYRYEIIKGAGHNAQVDNPADTNELIDNFIKDNCRSGMSCIPVRWFS